MRSIGKPIPEKVQQRALNEWYMELPETGCRISMGRYSESVGYHYIGGFLAHRAAYTAVNGQIPEGMVVDHKCFTRSCVNTDHLRLLTIMQNNMRREAKGRGWRSDWPLDECRWGHPIAMMRMQKTGDWAGRRHVCLGCQNDRNAVISTIKKQLRLLELAYGLGGHELKRNYASEIAKREARVEEVAFAREALAA
jgi:hypothetical protein